MIVNSQDTELIEVYLSQRLKSDNPFLWDSKEIEAWIKSSPSCWLGQLHSGRLVSLVLFSRTTEIIEIQYLETDPAFKRQGFMESLIGELLRQYPSHEFWLDVHEANSAALCFYEKMGFATSGRREKYYKDGGVALLMSLRQE